MNYIQVEPYRYIEDDRLRVLSVAGQRGCSQPHAVVAGTQVLQDVHLAHVVVLASRDTLHSRLVLSHKRNALPAARYQSLLTLRYRSYYPSPL